MAAVEQGRTYLHGEVLLIESDFEIGDGVHLVAPSQRLALRTRQHGREGSMPFNPNSLVDWAMRAQVLDLMDQVGRRYKIEAEFIDRGFNIAFVKMNSE